MRDPAGNFGLAGIVLGSWGLLGWALSHLWEPALLLAVPVVLWGVVLVLFVAIGIPAVWLHERYTRGWGR